MKKIFLSFIVLAFIFVGCEKEEVLENNPTKISKIESSSKGNFVDVVSGTFQLGENLIDEYSIDINDIEDFSDPIETEVYLGEKNRALDYTTLPNGIEVKYCPEPGKGCGVVYWIESDGSFEVIGFYSSTN